MPQPQPDQPTRGRLLSADEVAARLDMSHRTVRRISPAELPYLSVTDGGHRRYDPADVDRYVRRRTRRA
jgi:DNA-binding transcriptional MerR regulator